MNSPQNVFYPHFDRHAHGEGLKGHSTHYCAGCGHGLAHKYLAEAIADLGVQDRTVAVSPVGCAVFLYYYLDVGNTQAAHGRAPAVAIGHKMANPEAIVVAYQGDGDLASIGLAEIMQAAQMGLPISFIFINNAIYGMTGGQMAPTTLMSQTTTTSPEGRTRMMGLPLKMAETIAQLDGPAYVERVALFDPKQRKRAKKAIRKALQLQIEGRGLGFVEILAECPTHLHATPEETQLWVQENMLPVFPLGVKKDLDVEPWFELSPPRFAPEALLDTLGTTSQAVDRFAETFPTFLDTAGTPLQDIAIKFAGAGGDGAQTLAKLTCQGAIDEGFDATYIPSYGPESRGGTSYADVHIAEDEVLSPAAPNPHVLVAFNAPSLEKFGPAVRAGGIVIYDSTVVETPPRLGENVRLLGIPLTQIAVDLGAPRVKNLVALGVLQAATSLLPRQTFLGVLKRSLKGDEAMLTANQLAFDHGSRAVEDIRLRAN